MEKVDFFFFFFCKIDRNFALTDTDTLTCETKVS